MSIDPDWRAKEPLGAIHVHQSLDLDVADGWRAFDIRAAFASRADVVAELAQRGYTTADLEERGVLRSVKIQVLDGSDSVQFSLYAETGSPVPSDAILRAWPGGEELEIEFPTRAEHFRFWLYTDGANIATNITRAFDLPDAA